jgi:hypothetical protein
MLYKKKKGKRKTKRPKKTTDPTGPQKTNTDTSDKASLSSSY